MGSIRKFRDEDFAFLSNRFRAEDARECKALTGLSPTGSIHAYLKEGKYDYIWTLCDGEGTPGGVMGVQQVNTFPHVAHIWLMGTDLIKINSVAFLKRSRVEVKRLNRQWPVLTTFVHAANDVHVKWLRWLGFKAVDKLDNYGVGKETFYHMMRFAI